MKKILIVSYLFSPSNKMGAVRPTKLAKYLSQNKNYEVNVITASSNNDKVDSVELKYRQNLRITGISHSRFVKNNFMVNKTTKNNRKALSKNSNTSNYFKDSARDVLRFIKKTTIEFDFFNSFKKHIRENSDNLKDVDVLITTFGPLSSVLCGIHFKKIYKGVNWISDFRDPMVVDLRSDIENILYRRIQKKACELADCIVAVSSGYRNRICDNNTINKAVVIPNGFDRDDIINFSESGMDGKFSFAYTGYLYGGKRDIRPLFKVLRELIDSKYIDNSDIVFYYAGSDFASLYNQAVEYDLANILSDNGVLSREDSLRLQYHARYLVLSTWNYEGETGVFPGKFLEYMLMQKPIISIVSGKLSNSEVSDVIKRGNLGIAYEQGNHEQDIMSLKKYICEEYYRYKSKLKPNFNPLNEVVEEYNYEKISQKFMEII